MAVHKTIESDGQMEVTAAAHLSGPYSVSEKMIEYTLSDNEYFFSAYLANVSLSMKAAYPEILADYGIEDIFKAQYLPAINQFVAEDINLFQLNTMLEEILIQEVGSIVPKNMLHDSIFIALTTNPDHPISKTLALQDVYDWAPQAPTRIFYCEADEQVWYQNGVLAGEVMNENGAPDVGYQSLGPDLDHAGCAPPAVTSSMLFFLQYAELLSGVDDLRRNKHYHLSQNLVSDHLELLKSEQTQTGDHFVILDFQGKPVNEVNKIQGATTRLSVDNLPNGHYVMFIKEKGVALRFYKM